MARQAGNDRDINRLNETSHYAGAADFERSRFLLSRRVSHTLTPPDAIVSYLAEAGFGDTVPLRDFTFDNSLISALVERWRPETHTFHLSWGEVTITLQDVAYHLGLRAHGNPVGGCLHDFGRWYGTETWAMVEQLLGVRPPVAAQQAVQRKESFTLKLTSPTTWFTYGGYRFSGTSCLAECRALSWGSAVLAWTYQSLCLAVQWGVTDIAGCTPLLMSWIYQRFPQWCPPDRGVYQYPLAARLVGLQQQSRDQHQARVLYWRVSIDWLRFDEISHFAWRVYDDPALQALCPHWFREEEEWGTWLSAVPLVCFNIVRFHHVDRVNQQFNREQPVPGIPVNLDRYLTTTGHGEDVWWPERLQEWYDGWRQRFEPGRRIIVHHTFDTRPTSKYYDWWHGACRVRHLSGQEVLEDPRLVELPPDVQPTASQPRDDLTLPRGMPDWRRREPIRRERARPQRARGDAESKEVAEFDRQEDEGDVPVHSVASPTGSTPPPPPPPSGQGACHSSGSGGQQSRPAWDTRPAHRSSVRKDHRHRVGVSHLCRKLLTCSTMILPWMLG
ncbi:uncharacterized protein DS421_11g348690 [Arachis hypogaea]|nr:uncharacterized protein DS421_11g348690 [Arachis hypogaea]